MTLIELILEKKGKSPMFRYFPWDEKHVVDIFKEQMLSEGWTSTQQDITLDEYDEKKMASLFEWFAHRFYERNDSRIG